MSEKQPNHGGLPSCYTDAALYCVTSVCPTRGRLGLGLGVQGREGGVLRLALTEGDARALHAALGGYLKCGVQSPMSSDNPSSPGLPQEGQ